MEFSYRWNGLCPIPSTPQMIIEEPAQPSSKKIKASQPAEKEGHNDILHPLMKSGEQELRHLACVHGLSLTPCYAMLSDQGFQTNAWMPDLF